MNWEKIRKSLD